MRDRRALLVARSRQIRVAGIARTERVCRGPGAVRWPPVQASFGIDRRREPARPTITGQLPSPACLQVMSPQGHALQASRPSVESARKEEGENPRAVNQLGTRPPSRWSDARGSTTPAPQSKPVTHASRLVAHIAPSVAVERKLRILAAGPASHRLYSYRRHLCEPTPRVCSASPRARASADSPPAAGLVSQVLARRESTRRPHAGETDFPATVVLSKGAAKAIGLWSWLWRPGLTALRRAMMQPLPAGPRPTPRR